MFKSKPIHSVSEYLDRVDTFQKRWQRKNVFPWKPWFRGEPKRSSLTRLRPKLYRSKLSRKKLRYEEQELRLEFRRNASNFMQLQQPTGKLAHWDWYFLMQHHGVPTRLLDWSDGSLVGLYFATSKRNESDGNADAAVYVLDPYWLNDLAFKDLRLGNGRPRGVAFPDFSEAWPEIAAYLPEDPFDRARLRPELPLAITPSHLSARFAAQRSQFTIYGHDLGDRLLELAEDRDSGIRVVPVAAGKSITAIRTELANCGISESTVFPDLDGLGRELCGEWEARCLTR
jgi:hypothetical protein